MPQYLIPAIAAGYLVGKLGSRPALARAWLEAGAALALGGATTTILKLGFGRQRPFEGGDTDAFHPFGGYASFPSGHTTAAFAVATALSHNVRSPAVKVLLYAGATLTAFARINDDKHWLSDVIAGAAVGTLAARVATRRLFGHHLYISGRGREISAGITW